MGTPQKMTDGSKAVVWDAVMKPFGEMHSLTATATNDNRFPGQRLEAETGLHYNYFRDYDPTTESHFDPKKAVEHAKKALELNPDWNEAKVILRIANESLGNGEYSS